jgi:imidazolonepropionase-like amidohydrolase
MILLAGILAIGCERSALVEQKPGTILIENVNVLAMDSDQVLAEQAVVIEGGKITAVGSLAATTIPAGSFRIDGKGKYLIPGLVDVHVHLHANPPDEQRDLLELFVANGVTTIVNLRGTPQILALRSTIAQDSVLGPTLYTAGPYVNEPTVTMPDEVERAVVEQKQAGYDFIKLHGNLSRDAYARLMAVARREGIRVVGHAPRNLGVEAMFEEGQYAVAHAEEFIYDRSNSSREVIDIEREIPQLARRMAERRIWLMPNLTAFHTIALMIRDLDAILARPEMRYLPRSVQQGWGPTTNPYTARFAKDRYPSIIGYHALLQRLTREFHQAGVRLLVGTDAMNTGVVPGSSAHDELEELVAAGLTPFEALRAATTNAAEFLTRDEQRGTIAPGQNADLVLLDANPMESIANTRRIDGVMLRGRWLSKNDIRVMLNALATEK